MLILTWPILSHTQWREIFKRGLEACPLLMCIQQHEHISMVDFLSLQILFIASLKYFLPFWKLFFFQLNKERYLSLYHCILMIHTHFIGAIEFSASYLLLIPEVLFYLLGLMCPRVQHLGGGGDNEHLLSWVMCFIGLDFLSQ